MSRLSDRAAAVIAEYREAVSLHADLDFVVRAMDVALSLPAPAPPGEATATAGPTPDEARNATIANAAWIAASVAYARCFRTNKHRQGLRPLVVEKHPANVNGIHQYTMNVRDEHYAHRGSARRERTLISLLQEASAPDGPRRFAGFAVMTVKLVGGDATQTRDLKALAAALRDEQAACRDQLFATLQELGPQLTDEDIAELVAAAGRRDALLGVNDAPGD